MRVQELFLDGVHAYMAWLNVLKHAAFPISPGEDGVSKITNADYGQMLSRVGNSIGALANGMRGGGENVEVLPHLYLHANTTTLRYFVLSQLRHEVYTFAFTKHTHI